MDENDFTLTFVNRNNILNYLTHRFRNYVDLKFLTFSLNIHIFRQVSVLLVLDTLYTVQIKIMLLVNLLKKFICETKDIK